MNFNSPCRTHPTTTEAWLAYADPGSRIRIPFWRRTEVAGFFFSFGQMDCFESKPGIMAIWMALAAADCWHITSLRFPWQRIVCINGENIGEYMEYMASGEWCPGRRWKLHSVSVLWPYSALRMRLRLPVRVLYECIILLCTTNSIYNATRCVERFMGRLMRGQLQK